MICACNIYNVRIISIANMIDRFMISNTVRLLNACQILNDIVSTSNRNVYLYAYTYKLPLLLRLDHFTYFQYIFHLPTDFRHHLYSSDSHNHNIDTIDRLL